MTRRPVIPTERLGEVQAKLLMTWMMQRLIDRQKAQKVRK